MDTLAGKKIAVLGAGTEGTATAKWLLKHRHQVTVFDQADPKSRAELEKAGAEVEVGPKYRSKLSQFEVIFRSPGIPFLSPEIQQAIKQGVTVTSQTKLFFAESPAKIVGITGTKGKGTTATLLRDMLTAAGRKVEVGGNIGKPSIELLDDLAKDDLVILELSSFQLQDLEQSPALAIITNFGSDHLDHHQDDQEYGAAKDNILKYQSACDAAILNRDDPGSRRFDSVGKAKRYYFGNQPDSNAAYLEDDTVMVKLEAEEAIVATDDIPIIGPHNRSNILAASLAARLLRVDPEHIEQAVIDYQPLPYRLTEVAEKKGVRYINDSYSTSPTAAIPALESFQKSGKAGNVVFILGGAGKGLDYKRLAATVVQSRTKAVVLIGEVGPKIGTQIEQAAETAHLPAPKLVRVERKEDLLPTVSSLTTTGDIVLFSPAATSFDWFKSYQDRGKYFTEQVESL